MAATAADFPSGKAAPTQLGNDPIRRRQRRMRGNLPGPEGLAGRGASAALHGLPVVPPRAAPRALHPLPCTDAMAGAKPNCIARIYGPANAAHVEYSDRLPGLWRPRIAAHRRLRESPGPGKSRAAAKIHSRNCATLGSARNAFGHTK